MKLGAAQRQVEQAAARVAAATKAARGAADIVDDFRGLYTSPATKTVVSALRTPVAQMGGRVLPWLGVGAEVAHELLDEEVDSDTRTKRALVKGVVGAAGVLITGAAAGVVIAAAPALVTVAVVAVGAIAFGFMVQAGSKWLADRIAPRPADRHAVTAPREQGVPSSAQSADAQLARRRMGGVVEGGDDLPQRPLALDSDEASIPAYSVYLPAEYARDRQAAY